MMRKPADPLANPPTARRSERGKSHLDIATALGLEILSGTRAPGSRLPSIDEMFEIFGVSRIVVREVIRTLAAKGLVTSKTRIGTKVSDPSTWNWLDTQVLEWRGKVGLDQIFLTQLTQIRLALEPAAASLAAENRTNQDLAALHTALKAMYDAEDDHQKFSKADRDFHGAIITATHNPFFYSSSSATEIALFGFLSMLSIGATANKETHTRSAACHGKILEAIAARNQKTAAQAAIRVIKDGLNHASLELVGRQR
jgi:DNA-binding FadR family transcriptional regulator